MTKVITAIIENRILNKNIVKEPRMKTETKLKKFSLWFFEIAPVADACEYLVEMKDLEEAEKIADKIVREIIDDGDCIWNKDDGCYYCLGGELKVGLNISEVTGKEECVENKTYVNELEEEIKMAISEMARINNVSQKQESELVQLCLTA